MIRALSVLLVAVSGMPPEQKQTSYSLEAGAPREPCDDGEDDGEKPVDDGPHEPCDDGENDGEKPVDDCSGWKQVGDDLFPVEYPRQPTDR